jgi:hypothetical protein
VEDQEDRLILLCSNSILDILLVLAKKLRVKLDVARLVNTVNVTETGSDGEVWGDRRESLVDGKNVLWLSVKRVIIDILIVDSILLTTRDTNLLQAELDSRFSFDQLGMKHTISSHCFIGAARLRYFAVVWMLKSTVSSLRSIMWLEKRGSPFSLKCFSSASRRPSNHGRSFLAQ